MICEFAQDESPILLRVQCSLAADFRVEFEAVETDHVESHSANLCRAHAGLFLMTSDLHRFRNVNIQQL
jgi:hypothetical protein